ncbi:VQ domain-containing protein [Psidium guajava]|nr:VQ domain-containing protein [Psidium guajava]
MAINGPRPPLLKIHKDSRLIKKASSLRYPSTSSSSSSSNYSSSSCSSSLSNPNNHFPADSSQQQPRRPQPQGAGPVIIYTHSPKIIHTKARDFMALVQKLTGFSRPHHHDGGEPAPAPDPPQPQKAATDDDIALDEPDASSSVLSEDRRSGAVPAIHEANCISPILSHQNASISEIPLFTPNAADLFLSPGQRMYRYPYSAYMSPSAAHRTISPSMSEFMKEMPEC